tara:strand:+ start:67 stop:927 length:861 start_codon:yes stop_codon:yes gene_type:complete
MENKLKKYKIYSLRSYNDKSVIYYDYTTQFLHKRLSAIKSRYTRYLSNMDNFIVSFELFKLGNVYIELEEELECINREHLNAVLNKYIRDNDCLNKSYYDKIDKKDNDNINQQNQLTLYKSTPYIEEIQKDIKDIKNDNNVILTNKTDNINTDKNKNVILTDKLDNINTIKEIKPPTTSGIVKEPVKEIKPPTTSGIVNEKDKLNGLMNIQPPTINNIKTIDIKNKNVDDELEHYKQKYLYSNNDDNNSIKSLTSSVIKSNRNNKTIKVDFTTHSKTLKKKNFPKA